MTTVGDAFASTSKVASFASTTQGSGLPHVPQWGAPRSLGPIRFDAPQTGHLRTEIGLGLVDVLDRSPVVIASPRVRAGTRSSLLRDRDAWRGVYRRSMARPTSVAPARPATPTGVLFFIHGADETSEGLVENVARIEDQVRARGWDVTVVAPEWRRQSDLRLGNWKKAIHRRGRPSPMPVPILRAGLRKDAVMRIVTNYFEDRREALFEVLGPQMLADVVGYGTHRDSVQRILKTELTRAAKAAGGRPVLPVALSLGGIALVDLLGEWPEAPVEAFVTVGSQAPLLYTFDAIPSMPYDEASPPYLPVPWLNIYDSRDFLSFLAEPLFRRTDGLASVVDLRVHSGKDFPTSHSSYWELEPVWDAIATAFAWKRVEPLTVREARRLGFEARKAPAGK